MSEKEIGRERHPDSVILDGILKRIEELRESILSSNFDDTKKRDLLHDLDNLATPPGFIAAIPREAWQAYEEEEFDQIKKTYNDKFSNFEKRILK